MYFVEASCGWHSPPISVWSLSALSSATRRSTGWPRCSPWASRWGPTPRTWNPLPECIVSLTPVKRKQVNISYSLNGLNRHVIKIRTAQEVSCRPTNAQARVRSQLGYVIRKVEKLTLEQIFLRVKVKAQWSRHRPGVAQRVGRGIALLFHNRGTRRGWVVSVTPRLHFISGKDPVPFLHEAGWATGPVWTGGKSRPHRD